MSTSTLDAYISSSHSHPNPLVTSQPIHDRSSTFLASLYPVRSPASCRAAIKHHKYVIHANKPATHEIAAWRCMSLKVGRTGMGGDEDFEVVGGEADDGEKGGGRCIARVLREERVLDCVVIVSRWYGGTMLGPIRFDHIATCARQVCKSFKESEEVRECVALLRALDDELSEARVELEFLDQTRTNSDSIGPSGEGGERDLDTTDSRPKPPIRETTGTAATYTDLKSSTDLPRARRLVKAREAAIRRVKGVVEKRRKEKDRGMKKEVGREK